MRAAMIITCAAIVALGLVGANSASIGTGGVKSPWFCHDLDCPPFTVSDDSVAEGIELRSYSAGVWVSTNISDVKYDTAVTTGFMRLFEYISGANKQDQKIEMTAPVRTLLIPGDGPFCESHFKISFFVPYDLQGSAPEPSRDYVFIDPAEEQSFYVYSYSGFTSESKVMKNAIEVLDRLDAAGEKYDASYFYAAGYDAPFRLINRHNEIWIPAL